MPTRVYIAQAGGSQGVYENGQTKISHVHTMSQSLERRSFIADIWKDFFFTFSLQISRNSVELEEESFRFPSCCSCHLPN